MELLGKKLGWGTFAFLLVAMGLWMILDFGDGSAGDALVRAMGLRPYAQGGLHYTACYSLVFIIPAFLLGQKYRSQLLARAAMFGAVAVGLGVIVSVFALAL